MGKDSKIEWTNHTFNVWIGCTKVSAGCKFCYAETLDKRYRWEGQTHWGIHAPRKFQSEKYWHQLTVWNKAAEKAGERARVFCSSLADVFERHSDLGIREQMQNERHRLYDTIKATPWLIYILVTKRPENVLQMVPIGWVLSGFPDNVWVLTSVENQETANERIPWLIQIPAIVRGLSMEPLLGPVNLREVPYPDAYMRHSGRTGVVAEPDEADDYVYWLKANALQWVIVGGESGPNARPMHPDWVRAIRDDCFVGQVDFFFKQQGEWMWTDYKQSTYAIRSDTGFVHPLQTGLELTVAPSIWQGLKKVGKENSGRILDGRTHDEFPSLIQQTL